MMKKISAILIVLVAVALFSARAEKLDGVICGHFHIAALHDHFGLTYANCGDWIDSLTAIEDPGTGMLRRLGGRSVLIDRYAESPSPDTKEIPT